MNRKVLDDILSRLGDGVYFVDTERRITSWNQAAARISGYDAEEVIGTCCHDNLLMHVDHEGHSLCRGLCPLAATMQDGKERNADVFLHHKTGHRVPVHVDTVPVRNEDDRIVGAVEIFRELRSGRVSLERLRELESLALLDQVTRLPNRHHLRDELSARLAERDRYGVPFGVMLLDLDDFKDVNDTLGHAAGDELLRAVGKTMTHASRPFDTIGRWGGDEFLGIVRNVNHEQLAEIAERQRRLVNATRLTGHHDAPVTSVGVSIGATLVRPADDVASIVERADRLMYVSKSQGKNHVTLDDASV